MPSVDPRFRRHFYRGPSAKRRDLSDSRQSPGSVDRRSDYGAQARSAAANRDSLRPFRAKRAPRLVSSGWSASCRSMRSVVVPPNASATCSDGDARVPRVTGSDRPSYRLVTAVEASESESIALELQDGIVAANPAYQLV